MNYPTYDTPAPQVAAASLVAISRWIDEAPRNAARDREAATWGRLAKIQEEAGEVIAEFIAYTGQNPRKPQDNDALIRVGKELLDVALTALAAYEHLTAHRGLAVEDLFEHIAYVRERALAAPPAAEDESHQWTAEQMAAVAAVSELPRVVPNVSVTNAYEAESSSPLEFFEPAANHAPYERNPSEEDFQRMYLNSPLEPVRPTCPTCDSPEPGLHPATSGGEVTRVCSDGFHSVL